MKPFESYLLFYTVNETAKTVTVLRVMQDGLAAYYQLMAAGKRIGY